MKRARDAARGVAGPFAAFGLLVAAQMAMAVNPQPSAGGNFTAALASDGTVWTWGSNGFGHLGNNSTTDSLVPVQVTGLASVVAVSAGTGHSLALLSDGTVRSWGWNYSGQLGNNSATNSGVPVQVTGLTNIVAIAAGGLHSAALRADGTVWAWGYNQEGQLGNNSTVRSLVPVQVSGLNAVIAIATGDFHTVALTTDGTVWAWGRNAHGELGNGSTTNSGVPVPVVGLTNVLAIAGGDIHSAALRTDGTVWTWGLNREGQLGNNSTTNSPLPVQVTGLTNVASIAAGNEFSAAVKSDGTVWSWGSNLYGQLGNNSTVDSPVPVQVVGLAGVLSIDAGWSQTAALRTDGTIWTWGGNYYGELGDGSTVSSSVPVQVVGAGGQGFLNLGSATDSVVLSNVACGTGPFAYILEQTYGDRLGALSLVPTSSLSFRSVRAWLKTNRIPSAPVTLRIHKVAQPLEPLSSGNLVATSSSAAIIETSATEGDFAFSEAVSLNAGELYVFAFNVNGHAWNYPESLRGIGHAASPTCSLWDHFIEYDDHDGAFPNDVYPASYQLAISFLQPSDHVGPPGLPKLTVTPPASLDFGSIALKSSATMTVFLSNSGGGTLNGTVSAALPFSVSPASFSLNAGGQQAVTVSFKPTVLGPAAGAVVISSNGGASSLEFSGIGVTAPKLRLKPASPMEFSEILVDGSSSRSLRITNTGVSQLKGSCSTAAPFSVPLGCNINLAPGQSQAVSVMFAPSAVGEASAPLTFVTNASTLPKYSLTGTGVKPVVSVLPSTGLALGKVAVGSSQDSFVVVRNTGTGTLSTSCSVVGPVSLPTGCPLMLRPGFEARVPLRVSPVSAGPVNASISFGGNGGVQSVGVTADGVGASAITLESLTPTSGVAGTKVVLHGSNFGATQDSGVVRFGAYEAEVVGWSATDIVVLAPDRVATTAPVSVETAAGVSASRNFQYAAYWWPVPVAPRVAQDFAEWGDVSETKYHTGLDIGGVGTGTSVNPVGEGEVVFIQKLSATSDRGFGRTVIIKHSVAGSTRVFYSQYSHLSEISSTVEGEMVKLCGPVNAKTQSIKCASTRRGPTVFPKTIIGKTGGSGRGTENLYVPHLHFELKKTSNLGVSSCADTGVCSTVYGYTFEPPGTKGYYDPVEFLLPVTNSKWQYTGTPSATIVTLASTVAGRALPVCAYDCADPDPIVPPPGLRIMSEVPAGAYISYRGMPAAWGACASGRWVQIQKVSSPTCSGDDSVECFTDTHDPDTTGEDYLGLTPDVWICSP